MTEVELGEAVPLAHALVASVAVEQDVRVLFIKGPAAVLQDLRVPRLSVDVDAWVDPGRRERLAARLTELGWVDERPYTSPTVLPLHSLTHRHPSWACELDLHDRFPGFFADPQEVFERLWERRVTVQVAGREIDCPDPAAHALVLALHSLRDPDDVGKVADLTALVDRIRDRYDEAALRDLAELAHALGAADTAAPYLDRLGAPEVGRGTLQGADLRAWEMRTGSDSSVAGWLDELRRRPKRQWPRFLWYAAVLSEEELRLDDPSLPAGRRAVAKARLRRLRRGLRSAPKAWRSIRAAGRPDPPAGPRA
ncbi:MAG: nucleotidyltransferase family protein [Nocardioides sp.]